ncbi:MAG: DUF4190 domain-containing protein [Anaerolineales bacterium]|nr:DUF4190 domain-containing protein [Anaerolineales bacterium]
MSEAFEEKTNSLALAGMITGIAGMLGIVLCCCSPIVTSGWCGLFGIPAAIMGYMAKQQIAARGGEEKGQTMALAAMILGGVEITIALAGAVIFILALTGFIALPALDSMFSSLN